MKITKSKLKQIIKEEIESVLKEQRSGIPSLALTRRERMTALAGEKEKASTTSAKTLKKGPYKRVEQAKEIARALDGADIKKMGDGWYVQAPSITFEEIENKEENN